MKFKDDRTDEQKRTHTVIVLMTDSFLSGWGGAAGGVSYAGWACEPAVMDRVESWVRRRGDAKRIRVVGGNYRPSSRTRGDCHIYVVGPEHPAL